MKLPILKTLFLSAGMLVATTAASFAEKGSLVVYNPPGAVGDALIAKFKTLHPGIDVQSVAGGVGELFTRMAAEAANPRGDVIICASTEAVLAQPELLQAYDSKEKANFPAEAIVDNGLAYGCSLALQAFVVNTKLLDEAAMPKSWKDLTDPRFAEKLTLANPSTSGSAYAQLAQMLQLYGWDYVNKVMDNASIVTASEAVFTDVARGEKQIGVSNESNIQRIIEQGNPVRIVYPSEGTAFRYDASALVRGGPNPENAKLFLDFLNSKQGHEILAQFKRRSVRPDVDAPAGLTPTAKIVTFPYDVKKASSERNAYLAKWETIFNQ
jgi:iron(III) transport system substrate-binding protein